MTDSLSNGEKKESHGIITGFISAPPTKIINGRKQDFLIQKTRDT